LRLFEFESHGGRSYFVFSSREFESKVTLTFLFGEDEPLKITDDKKMIIIAKETIFMQNHTENVTRRSSRTISLLSVEKKTKTRRKKNANH